MKWTVERDEWGQLVLPYYGAVKWHDHEADTFARQFLIVHRPVGAVRRLTIKPPFLGPNEYRTCMECPPGTLYSACQFQLWAKAWQKTRPPRDESDAYRWRS